MSLQLDIRLLLIELDTGGDCICSVVTSNAIVSSVL